MLLADGSVRRSSALMAAGIAPHAIASALKVGRIARSAAGAYYCPGACPTPELAGLASAAARMPRGVACLISSAYLCGLADELSRPIWMALPLQAHEAKAGEVPMRVLRWSYRGAFERGIEESHVCGVLVRHTGAARTILDLIRYARHLGGPDMGIAAARRFVANGGAFGDVLALAEEMKPPKEAAGILSVLGVAFGVPPR
jgi:predicted transcriptional regulator of viral defense system